MKMCWIQKLRQNECILVKMKALISELSNYELDNTELQITFGQLLFWEPTNFKLLERHSEDECVDLCADTHWLSHNCGDIPVS